MPSPHTVISFLITLVIYVASGAAIYHWFFNQPEVKVVKAAQAVPITLNMFQTPAPVVEPEVVEPVVPPKPPEPPKPIVEKVIEKPKKLPPKKIEKSKPKPPEKKVVKKPDPPKPQKPIETKKPKKVEEPPPVNQYALFDMEEEEEEEEEPTPQYSLKEKMDAERAYLGELNRLLENYAQDTYPRRAKRRNWESDVSVTFTLLANGDITNLTISDPSKRAIFNDAALDIFKSKLKMKFKSFPEKIERESWTLEVPISYTLR